MSLLQLQLELADLFLLLLDLRALLRGPGLGPAPLRANFSCARVTSLVSPDPSGSVAAWATNERPVRSEVRSCDAAGVELPPYSVSLVSL